MRIVRQHRGRSCAGSVLDGINSILVEKFAFFTALRRATNVLRRPCGFSQTHYCSRLAVESSLFRLFAAILTLWCRAGGIVSDNYL